MMIFGELIEQGDDSTLQKLFDELPLEEIDSHTT
jgi:hypothetical protein